MGWDFHGFPLGSESSEMNKNLIGKLCYVCSCVCSQKMSKIHSLYGTMALRFGDPTQSSNFSAKLLKNEQCDSLNINTSQNKLIETPQNLKQKSFFGEHLMYFWIAAPAALPSPSMGLGSRRSSQALQNAKGGFKKGGGHRLVWFGRFWEKFLN